MEADANGDGFIDYDEWMAVQKMQKARRLGVDSASSRRSARETSEADRVPVPNALPHSSRSEEHLPRPPPSPGRAVAAGVTSTAGLRELLAGLCQHGAAESGVVNAELAAEAEWLLTASLEAEVARLQAEENDEGDGGHEGSGMLPNARNRQQRERAIELANVLIDRGAVPSSSSDLGAAAIMPATLPATTCVDSFAATPSSNLQAGGGGSGGGSGGGFGRLAGGGDVPSAADDYDDEEDDGEEEGEEEEEEGR